MLPLSVSGYFPHRVSGNTANIYKRRSCGNGQTTTPHQPILPTQSSASKRRNIYQQREAQSCDDLLGSGGGGGGLGSLRLASQSGKSEYALNEASFYARVSLDRLREVKQMKGPNSHLVQQHQQHLPESAYPPPPDQFGGNNRTFSDMQKSKSFHRIQPLPHPRPPPQLYSTTGSPCKPLIMLTSNNNHDSTSLDNRPQQLIDGGSCNPYMAHLYPKNFHVSTPPSLQQESIYQVILPPMPAGDGSVQSHITTDQPSSSELSSNRTSATISEEAVTRFGETEESGSEQM